jgi:ABC-type Mn2+/Zn2+ transport system permease subunit
MDFINTLAFVYEGVLAGLLIALSCSMVGVYLLMRRLSMLGAGISHSAFGGIAIAFLLGLEPTLFTLFYVALTSVLLQFLMDSKRLPSDTILSLFFSFGTALAVIVSAMKENLSANIYSYLFGSLLAVSKEELYVSLFVFFNNSPCLLAKIRPALFGSLQRGDRQAKGDKHQLYKLPLCAFGRYEHSPFYKNCGSVAICVLCSFALHDRPVGGWLLFSNLFAFRYPQPALRFPWCSRLPNP